MAGKYVLQISCSYEKVSPIQHKIEVTAGDPTSIEAAFLTDEKDHVFQMDSVLPIVQISFCGMEELLW